MTQKELAEILLLSESAVSKWESGKRFPDVFNLGNTILQG